MVLCECRFRDTAQIIQRSIEAPEDLRYGIYYATSDNMWKIFDINLAKTELGYAPEDDSGGEFTEGPPPIRDQ